MSLLCVILSHAKCGTKNLIIFRKKLSLMKKTVKTKKEKKIVVLYHKNCLDGFTAAWTAYKHFGAKADYIPLVHQTPPPKNLSGKEVYMVDFCYNEDVMSRIKKQAERLVVIDHHISQEEAVKISDEHLYDLKASGATLTHKYFFPKKPIPKISLYVEDRDIWKNKIKDAVPILAVLNTLDFDFRVWDSFAKKLESAKSRAEILKEGRAIMKSDAARIRDIVASAEPVKLAGKSALAVNSPVLVSDIGHELAKAAGGLGIIWYVKSGRVKISLRATGKVDAQKIAKKFGGGGHVGAASFSLPYDGKTIKLPWGKASGPKKSS